MIVDIEAWLPDLYLPKVEVGPGSPCEPEQVFETGACLESQCRCWTRVSTWA